jgi:hypothetical protein
MKAMTAGDTLLPVTKLVLIVSAVTQLVFAAIGLLLLNVWNGLIWTAPLPPYPVEIARMDFLTYIATAAAAIFAVYQGKWSGAKVFLVFGFLYNLLCIVIVILNATTTGVPPILWLLVALAVIYLPVVAYVWRQQEASRV